MACKFCPKIRRGDLLFIVVAGVAFYGVYSYQMRQVQQAQEKRAQDFKKLQESCVLNHDKKACQEVFRPGSSAPQR
ncbi:hypothetical protein [Helicobacter ailurogastricus]|uniref:Uncharacterized protein n=1 Tax=Helicobacter ailurogastricus TaxID=1578720 RepID=A0A0K2X5Z8_9HELI|nr:hypothetical protein [Helicobacter ailurogastricus]CRF41207.1 hypothetical protein HAL011_09940 [Helicobacter ailurogastricus]CRF41912.1 hypothetical protein HAL013_00590 [Helicobacter ailurogastricus]CRF43755.1 hypothetical protein HAL09_03050 [Helicobacter ailurogastricus]CRI32302.1 hypothetical protein HAL07_07770 [Helicobacter ailurogastricus]